MVGADGGAGGAGRAGAIPGLDGGFQGEKLVLFAEELLT